MGIDIILPVYNGCRWLDECVSSVLEQTYSNWHLTIVDDGSTDGSLAKARGYCSRERSRIDLIVHSENRRAAACRMEAIRRSSAQAIAFIDQDDRWLPQKLEEQVDRLASEPGVKAVHTDVIHIDAEGQPILGSANSENARRAAIRYEAPCPEERAASLFRNNSIRLGSALIERLAFLAAGGFDEARFGGEDWEFWVRFSHMWPIGHLAEPLVERRIHSANTSERQALERTHGLLEALALVETRLGFLKPLARERRSWLLQRLILKALRAGELRTARRGAWQMLGQRPSRLSYLACIALGLSGPLGRRLFRTYQIPSVRRALTRSLLARASKRVGRTDDPTNGTGWRQL